MPSLSELLNNMSSFRYYSGQGTFNANKLPYGNDLPGGGSSSQPYIKREIGQKWSLSNFDEGLMPGGIMGSLSRSGADVLRIGKFFLDPPKGPLWLAKQTGLQLMNPLIAHDSSRTTDKLTTGQGFFNNVGNFVTNTVNRITNDIGSTRIYNPLGTNTLAQVGVNAFGIHFPRHGVLPVLDKKDLYSNAGADSIRFINLAQRLSSPDDNSNFLDKNIIDKYKGGAQSFLGIGETIIKRYGNTYGLGNNSGNTNNFISIPLNTIFKIEEGGLLDRID